MTRISHHITNEDTTVSECLKKHFRLDSPQILELIRLGAIYSDKKRVLCDRKLPKGTYLRLHLQPKRFDTSHIDWAKVIVRDEREFLIVNKPAGLPVHASLDNQDENVLTQLRRVTGYSLFVTQRLDIPVTGLLVMAKTPEFQRRFNQWLVDRKVHKEYVALTEMPAAVGHHTHFMQPSERSPRVLSAQEKPGWAKCELTVLSTEPFQGDWQSAVVLHTGRTHQIRAQLSVIGAAILGDRQYGARRPYHGRIALCSRKVEFPLLSGQRMVHEITPPWRENISPVA